MRLARSLSLLWCSCLLLLPASAAAQFGGSVVVESDYRFRGVSLSAERPNLRLSLAYDHASGAYGGLMLSGLEIERGRRQAALQAYAGWAGPLGEDWHWELGGSYSASIDGRGAYNYGELFAGLLAQDGSLRLYAAPDYFGWSEPTLYLEADRGWALAGDWRVVGHLGLLQALGRDGGHRADARLGLQVRAAPGLSLQLAWLWTGAGGPFPAPYEQRRSTPWLSVSHSF